MEGQGQCRVVQYRVEREREKRQKKERRWGGRRREDMETEEGRKTGDKEQ